MPDTTHALDFLDQAKVPSVPMIVLFGDEPFLHRMSLNRIKQQLLDGEEADVSFREFDGASASWRDVHDELATVSLFASDGPRLVSITNVDSFLKTFRDRLEDYADKPAKTGVLVLMADSWPSNTRLFKKIAKVGLQVDCRPPKKSARSKAIDLNRIAKWIQEWGSRQYGVNVSIDGAQRMLDLIGPEFGMIDQELAKIAVFVDSKTKVDAKLIESIVGGWRCESVWEAIDSVLQGDVARALTLIDQLIQSGESPVGMMGQISWSLRRFSSAALRYDEAERNSQPITLEAALREAGFQLWDRSMTQKTMRQLKRLGRSRALLIPERLLKVDLALKGSHSQNDRARFAIEELFHWLATAS